MKAPPLPAERDLDAEEIRAFFEAWGQDASKESTSCEFCSAINISTQDNVRAKLEILTLRFSTPKGLILSCPRCGQLYQHVSWMETPDWLDSMSGVTEPYENECLYKRTADDAMAWVLNIAAKGEGRVKLHDGGPRTSEILENVRFLKSIRHEGAHCPKCRSINVRATGGWYEFTRMHCDDCGDDELLDEYQLEEWYA